MMDGPSAETTAEAIREFDHDSIRVIYVGGFAARPVDGRVVELEPKAEVMDTPDGFVDVVHN
jgi:hypothetical protein